MGNEEEAEGDLEDLFAEEPAHAPLLQPLPDAVEQGSSASSCSRPAYSEAG